MEYYFSDVNLVKDRFLQDQMAASDGGWIPIELLLSFHRLASITKDADLVLESLKKSASGLLEVDEQRQRVRRSPLRPIPANIEQYKKDLIGRTVYIKGFPLDLELDDLHAFCSKLGPLESVAMRRKPDKSFNGSVFAMFKTPEDARRAVKMRINYRGRKLMMEMEERYLERVRSYNRMKMKDLSI